MATQLESLRQCAFELDPKKRRPAGDGPVTRQRTAKKGRVTVEQKPAPPPPPSSEFSIEVRFLGGLSPTQQDVFERAAKRWSEIIVGDLPSVRLPTGEIVDDVLIDAQGVRIDGVGGTLGRAGPRFVRQDSSLPAFGIMEFDSEDIQRMEADGSLLNVIIHEMGHVLGLGTIWAMQGLSVGCDTANPVFLGQHAAEEFGALISGPAAVVPIANTGGPGTRCGHWRETVFGHELMTGFLGTGDNPLSRLTVASLEDLGYQVDFDAADDYSLPSAMELALMGVGADGHRQCCEMCGGGVRKIEPIVLPLSAYAD